MKRLTPLLIILCGLCGCGTPLRERAHSIEEMIGRARARGAYICAPRELAMAVSHVDFAKSELSAGNYYRALDEVEVAEDNARMALAMSPEERCARRPSAQPLVPARVAMDADRDGIPDSTDKCPTEPEDRDGFQDDDGCPDPDNDQDGILDRADKCPDQPEDKDGFEDEDGCPDPDNDKDGILDADDKCPTDPGPKEQGGCPDKDRDGDGVVDRLDHCPDAPGDADNSGCPRQKYIIVHKDRIELRQKVHFATAAAKIMSDSFAMLTEVAEVLTKRPEIRVRIEGHTDARGGRKYNMTLSQARATAVQQFLIGKGVDSTHMEAKGYGPTQPLADNRTAAGREQNRRVEFIITSQ